MDIIFYIAWYGLTARAVHLLLIDEPVSKLWIYAAWWVMLPVAAAVTAARVWEDE